VCFSNEPVIRPSLYQLIDSVRFRKFRGFEPRTPTRSGCGGKSAIVVFPAGQRAYRNGSGTSSGVAIQCLPARRRRQPPGKHLPATGEVVWFLADAVNTAMFSEILAAFAREVGAGPDNLVVLVLDGAGWHVATDLVVPEGIHLEFLPPYSPELQPAEHLWPLINEPLANRHFTTLADLDQALGQRCCDLADDDDRIRSSTHFHWWPAFI
jgi:transposase